MQPVIWLTNEKVAGFEPRWAPFRGFTLLFDNPGANLKVSGGLSYVDCDVDRDPDLLLYKALRDGIQQIGQDLLTNTYLFCPLPPASYHVTVWDGVNDGNLAQVLTAHHETWKRFLQEPWSVSGAFDLFREITVSDLISKPDWNIQLRFEALEKWSNVSIVARLAPANATPKNAVAGLTDARAGLTRVFESRFGVGPHLTYAPHVTLGYFANQNLADETNQYMEQWDAIFRELTNGLILVMHRVSLYGFTDMATFFKIPEP